MKYRIHDFTNPVRARRVRNAIYSIAVLTMIPACWLTYRMLQQSAFQNNCNRFVEQQFNFPGTQVLHSQATMKGSQRTLTVSLVGRVLPEDSLVLALTDRLPDYGLGGTRLDIIQGDEPAAFNPTEATSTMLRDMYQVTQATINTQRATIDSLRAVTASDTISAALAPELRVVFPQVSDIAVTRAIAANVDNGKLDTINAALVTYRTPMSAAQAEKFRAYLEARLGLRNVTIIPTTRLTTAPRE